MADRYLTGNVRTYSTSIPGRHITSARANHFIVDDAAGHGGPGEAPNALEFFMTGITACATLMMERIARAQSIPMKSVEVTMDGVVDTEAKFTGPAVLSSAKLVFTLAGVSDAQANEMVEVYKHR